ncbi:thiolase [Glonium stellatum]|uniref:acetyl-CoA C-acyltransferase n=1 Tax=Glonium stellatum TaxID=574774 RepID=A0A8E2EZ49_9PEZI|nr:thiolase [Glonium stellatum]
MSINWVMLSEGGGFTPLPGEKTLYTSPPRTTLSLQSLNKYPGKEPYIIQSSAGCVHLTNRRLIYLPASPTPELHSFAAPILNLHDTHVTAPWFGPNVWTAIVQPVSGGGIPAQHAALELKITFKEGGAFDFHTNFERLKERLQQAVEVARESGYITGDGSESGGGRGAGALAGVNLDTVHLDELPTYEESGQDPQPGPPAALATPLSPQDSGVAVLPEPARQPSPQPSPREETFSPPTEPPPGYEEVQRGSIVDELERRLRSAEEDDGDIGSDRRDAWMILREVLWDFREMTCMVASWLTCPSWEFFSVTWNVIFVRAISILTDINAREANLSVVAQERLSQVSDHLKASEVDVPRGREALLEKHPDDVVVTCALRTAITKGGKGGFKDTAAADLLHGAFKSLISRSGIDPSLVEDIAVGTVLAPGGGATEFRAAALAAGFPVTSAVKSLNRQCSSGLQACVDVANAIKSGMIEIGIGAGVESMSTQYGPQAVTEFSELLDSHAEAKNCKVPMGVLSEKMAKNKKIARANQDSFAAQSFQKAVEAQKKGLFDEEIIPLTVKYTDPKTDEEKTITVSRDDGVREGITAESLGKIRPAFAKDGTIHAGNASQISDGAAAVLLMKRSTALRLSQPILGKFVQASVVGVPPLLMGVGPAAAIPVALKKAGLDKDDVDIYEINEAFASQCLFCINELGLDMKKVNPKGGAIAFGHPLGCTGARQVSTLLTELRRTKQRIGVTSMCIGTGMGMAAVWVAE